MDELILNLKQKQKAVRIALLIDLIVIVGTFAAVYLARSPFPAVIGAALFILAVINTSKKSKQYTLYFKENVVKNALCEVFDNVSFTPDAGIPWDVVSATGMINTGNRFNSNDLVTGTYKGVAFKQSDVLIEEETTDSEGNTSTSTIFMGRWMIFDFNKEFRCEMQMISKGFFASKRKGGIFARKENKLNKLEFENEEFNKQFKVYAQNQEEAFYLITPQIMDALLKLRSESKAPLMLMFTGGVLHIALQNNKDAFEAKIFGNNDPESEKERIVKDIRVITDFIDGMAMDRDIYKN